MNPAEEIAQEVEKIRKLTKNKQIHKYLDSIEITSVTKLNVDHDQMAKVIELLLKHQTFMVLCTDKTDVRSVFNGNPEDMVELLRCCLKNKKNPLPSWRWKMLLRGILAPGKQPRSPGLRKIGNGVICTASTVMGSLLANITSITPIKEPGTL